VIDAAAPAKKRCRLCRACNLRPCCFTTHVKRFKWHDWLTLVLGPLTLAAWPAFFAVSIAFFLASLAAEAVGDAGVWLCGRPKGAYVLACVLLGRDPYPEKKPKASE
jgi:hypothetical protein